MTEQYEKPERMLTLRPHIDWICLWVACGIGLLSRYVKLHIPW